MDMEFALRGLLMIVGLTGGIHFICIANFLKPGSAPTPLTLSLAASVAFFVGMVHGAYLGETYKSLVFALFALASVITFKIVTWAYGFHINRYFARKMHDKD